MLNIIGWIVIGAITGVISTWLVPGNQNLSLIMMTLIGIAGSFVGGFIGGMFTKEKDMLKPTPSGFIMSIIGGFVLVLVLSKSGLIS